MLSAGFAVGIVFISLISSEGNASEFRKALESGTFLQAFEACNEFGDGWALLSPSLSREELARAMSTTNLSSAWMGIQREVADWTWVNGTSYTNFTRTEPGRNCAQLDVSNQKLFAASCADQGIGFLCELQAGEVCPSDILFSQACFSLGETRGILACRSKNWFHARSFCREVAWRLVIPDARKIEAVTRLIADRRIITECSYVYIGLHRERWLSKKPGGGIEEVRKYDWAANEPFGSNSRCAEATKDGTWKVRDCETRTAVLCQNDTPTPSSDRKGEKMWRIVAIVLMVIIAVVAVTAVVLLLVKGSGKFKWRRSTYKEVSTEEDIGLSIKQHNISKRFDCVTIVLFCVHKSTDSVIGSNRNMSKVIKFHEDKVKEIEGTKIRICRINISQKNYILSKQQGDEICDYLICNKENIDIAYLPGMELNAKSLSLIKELRQRVALFCLAKVDCTGNISAETIAIGFTETQYRRRHPDIIANDLLDVTCNTESTELGPDVDPKVAHTLLLTAKRIWRKKAENQQINQGTAEIRRYLIGITQREKSGHHPYTGFGEIPAEDVSPSDSQDASDQSDGEQSADVDDGLTEKKQRKVVLALGSTGIDTNRAKLKKWNIQPFEESRTGDEDSAQKTGTCAAELLVFSLNKLGLDSAQVDILDLHIPKGGCDEDWPHFEDILSQLKEKKVDIVYITSGLGHPPVEKSSAVANKLHELKEQSVVLTSSVLKDATKDIYADFPSESVISVRVDKDPFNQPSDRKKYARGATVDFVMKGPPTVYSEKVWNGGVRTMAIIAKILVKSRDLAALPDISNTKLRKTDMMHEILSQLSKGTSHDGICVIESEETCKGRIESDLSKYISDARSSKKYWAGKNIN